MAKPRYIPLDDHGWFERADHFHYTSMRLSAEPQQLQFIYARPHIVLKAFAAEAYLKSLLLVEGTDFPQIHDLLSLFDKLQPESKKLIERWWNKESKPILEKARKSSVPDYKAPRSLRGALNESSSAFLDWRYHGKKAYIGFSILAFPHFVRKRILQLKPEWAHQEPHPLAFLNPEPEFVESKDDGFRLVPVLPAILNPKTASFKASLRAWGGSNPKDRGSGESR